MSESQSWRRGFAAGFVALALSVGGQLATRAVDRSPEGSCPLARGAAFEHFPRRSAARVEAQTLAQRVALAVIGAVLHGWC